MVTVKVLQHKSSHPRRIGGAASWQEHSRCGEEKEKPCDSIP